VNDSRLNQLWAAARACPPVEPPEGFVGLVLRVLGQRAPRAETTSLFEQLSLLFPRLATTALLIIAGAAAFEYFSGADLFSELVEASDQWLLPMNWL